MAQEKENLTFKARPMNKDELNLLELINNKKNLTTKATNASNNRLKEEAWKTIADDFSAQVGESRRPEQLRLKWENVKKAARKRLEVARVTYRQTKSWTVWHLCWVLHEVGTQWSLVVMV